MGAGHRQGTISHREAHAFDGSRADISGRQDARYTRFQRARLAIRPRPQPGSEDVGAGQYTDRCTWLRWLPATVPSPWYARQPVAGSQICWYQMT